VTGREGAYLSVTLTMFFTFLTGEIKAINKHFIQCLRGWVITLRTHRC